MKLRILLLTLISALILSSCGSDTRSLEGLAADIFKVALVNLDQKIDDKELASRIVLQVHDEVILECPLEEIAEAESLTVETMSAAFDLLVPLEVNVSSGQSWAEAK